jgi:hypothetical protein
MSNLTVMPTRQLTSTTLRADTNRFVLFSNSWINLQSYVQAGLLLPITKGNFVEKYGEFSSQQLITNTVQAMKKVQNLSESFGNPTLIKKKILESRSYLTSKTAPTEIYGHIVWLAMQMQAAAGRYQNTLKNVERFISTGTKEERANNLKDILIGRGGLITVASDMQTKTDDLLEKLLKFDGHITDANTQLVTYTRQGSDLIKEAEKISAKFQEKIDKELKPAAKTAWDRYIGFTVGAATAPVAIFFVGMLAAILAPVTFGTSLVFAGAAMAGSAGAAIALAVAAGEQNKIYNNLQAEIKASEKEIQKKALLTTDLGSFNSQAAIIGTGLSDFKGDLQKISGMWLDVQGNLAYICNNYTVDQLADLSWVNQAMQLEDAGEKWNDIKVTAQEFTQNSLIDFQIGEFGDPLPIPADVKVA